MFRVSQHPSSGVLKTVTAASGTGHNIGPATCFQRGQVLNWPRWKEVALHHVGHLLIYNDSLFYQLDEQIILINLLYSSTCFEHSYVHLQEDNYIITTSGIVTIFG